MTLVEQEVSKLERWDGSGKVRTNRHERGGPLLGVAHETNVELTLSLPEPRIWTPFGRVWQPKDCDAGEHVDMSR